MEIKAQILYPLQYFLKYYYFRNGWKKWVNATELWCLRLFRDFNIQLSTVVFQTHVQLQKSLIRQSTIITLRVKSL
jgi:hypothetical protein